MDIKAAKRTVKYSFIVPVYNVEAYLSKCLDSMLTQTFRDFEIIIVDDGTKDRSGLIADEYQQKYPQYIQVIHQSNKGLGGARNTGIEHAEGEYLLFVDSDDYVRLDMLEVIDRYEKESPFDILTFGCVIADEGQEYQIKDDASFARHITQKQHLISPPTACLHVYHASLFRENTNLRYPEKIYYEDLALTPCIAIHADRIYAIEEKLYFYVQRETSIMHDKSIDKMLDIIPAFDLVLTYYAQHGKSEEFSDELEWLAIQHVVYYSIRRIMSVKYKPSAISKLLEYMKIHFPDFRENPYLNVLPDDINHEMLRCMINGEFRKLNFRVFRLIRLKYSIKQIIKRGFFWK